MQSSLSGMAWELIVGGVRDLLDGPAGRGGAPKEPG